jgi:hypothetical protein
MGFVFPLQLSAMAGCANACGCYRFAYIKFNMVLYFYEFTANGFTNFPIHINIP